MTTDIQKWHLLMVIICVSLIQNVKAVQLLDALGNILDGDKVLRTFPLQALAHLSSPLKEEKKPTQFMLMSAS
jgi:hypothetical protein